MHYAIVDIETTGSYAAANGITEISVHVFDGHTVIRHFETLVNPRQPIPRYIQSMTGITDEMVEQAPVFETIAPQVAEILQDAVFVAHSVSFDYSFIKSHLRECGYDLQSKKLCTVRLSRKIFPGLPSYSLGNLCRSLEISIQNRHRAGGDAAATVELFRKLLENDKENHIQKSLKRNSGEAILPPHLPKADFDNLPYQPGVYYFHNEKGKVVYVGKATNIKYRVSSHFSNNSESRQKQNFMLHTHRISYQICGTELMACILESAEIKKRWPVFNQSQKKWEDVYGIFSFEDQNGYQRLAIDKTRNRMSPHYSFHYLTDGHALLRKLVKEEGLCPKLCFLQQTGTDCEGIKEGHCAGACEQQEDPASYNKKVESAIRSLQNQPSFAIWDQGIGADDRSCILVIGGHFYGMGYLPAGETPASAVALQALVTQYRENSFIRNLVLGYAARYPAKVQILQP